MALSDSSGNTVETYEYSVYGEVAVEDANHTNPYMFAGVRYDIEIGLYYNRARYYNPFTGRFLQTDRVGYQAGMNLYRYCGNNPLNFVDPSGLIRVAFYDPTYEVYDANDNVIETTGQMEAWADDSYFDVRIPMWSSQDVLDGLQRLIDQGYKIDEVFFFDHSVGTGDPARYGRLNGLQFGDETLSFDDGTMEKFFKDMKGLLGAGIEYHSRSCYLGNPMNYDRLMSIAEWTEGTVTGAVGHLHSNIYKDKNGQWTDTKTTDPRTGKTVDVPDYWSPGGYTKATYTSDGVSITPYSRPVIDYPWGAGTLLTY